MKAVFRFTLILFVLILPAVLTVQASNTPLHRQLSDVAHKLDQATFQTVRRGWTHDYGFQRGTGMLNSYEYLRSLLSYAELQSRLPMSIYTKGPHTRTQLDLQNERDFGHYNPEFVRFFHSTVNKMLSSNNFTNSTHSLVTKTGLLEKFERLYHIYQYIEQNKDEYQTFKSGYKAKLAAGNWPEGGYRDLLPKKLLDSHIYWNWAETVYYFWIRRDIDGSKERWFALINDVLNAYNVDKKKILKRLKKSANY